MPESSHVSHYAALNQLREVRDMMQVEMKERERHINELTGSLHGVSRCLSIIETRIFLLEFEEKDG